MLPREPAERARLAGGGRLVLSDREDIALQVAPKPLEGAVLGGAKRDGDRFAVVVGPKEPARVVVDLESAADDPAGTIRVFDLAERDEENRLVGGTTFVTLATAR